MGANFRLRGRCARQSFPYLTRQNLRRTDNPVESFAWTGVVLIERWRTWRENPDYQPVAPLRRVLKRMGEDRAAQVLAFLQRPGWEATNNGAERVARQFRHLQAACFKLRTEGVAVHGNFPVAGQFCSSELTGALFTGICQSGPG